MTPRLTGIGLATPPGGLDQAEALRLAEQCCAASSDEADRLRRLFEHCGVQRRQFVVAPELAQTESAMRRNGHGATQTDEPVVPFFPPRLHDEDLGPSTAQRLAVYDLWASRLAGQAAAAALAQAGCAAARITHLITVSCTGMHAPGVDIALIDELDLPRSVRRANIGFMGCHAAINALRLAADACRVQTDSVVLVVCVELCSVHFQYRGDGDRLLANALFADGAAAAVVSNGPSRPGQSPLAMGDFASVVVPDSRECMSWSIGDHGFEMRLSLDVPARIRECAKPWMEQWLARRGLAISDVGSWAVHPGGPRILDAFAAALDLPPAALQASRDVLGRLGNMSSPTVLFILDELLRRRAPRPAVAIAFGPGLTIEAALLE